MALLRNVCTDGRHVPSLDLFVDAGQTVEIGADRAAALWGHPDFDIQGWQPARPQPGEPADQAADSGEKE